MLMFIDFWTRLTQTNLIIGLVLAILGLGLLLLSRKIVKSYKKADVSNDDHMLMILRGFGLVLIMIAMFIMILY